MAGYDRLRKDNGLKSVGFCQVIRDGRLVVGYVRLRKSGLKGGGLRQVKGQWIEGQWIMPHYDRCWISRVVGYVMLRNGGLKGGGL